MSRYNRDDGSFGWGMFTMATLLAAFIAGYALRDSDFQFAIKRPAQEVKK
jgi:hypothetical protein